MSISYRAGSTAATGGNGTLSLVISKPSGVVDGDVMLAFVSDTAPNGGDTNFTLTGWTSVGGVLDDERTSPRLRANVYWKLASSEPGSYTITADTVSGRIVAIIEAYSGASTVAPTAHVFAGTDITAGYTTESITTDADAWLIWSATDVLGVTTFSSTGTARHDQSTSNTHVGTYDTNGIVGAGTYQKTVTTTGTATDNWITAIVPLLPATSSPTPVDASRARYLIDFSGSAASSGGALSYSIAQTSGTTTTPEVVVSGMWAVVQSETEALGYTVTVTEAGGGTATADTVVPQKASGTTVSVSAPLAWNTITSMWE